MKEFPSMSVLSIHENLIEALLELQNYNEVQVNLEVISRIYSAKGCLV